MGRGNDYREPRRRGFDDDDFAVPQFGGGQRPASAPPRQEAGPPIAATVRWYNNEKGFGFVALGDGSDAFLHASILERTGHSSLQPGAMLRVRVGPGSKGAQVIEVLTVDENTATPPSQSQTRSSVSSQPTGTAIEMTGVVKWYNADKGYGFVAVEGSGKDVFVHVTALRRNGLSGLQEGQRITMDVAEGSKGPEATVVRLTE